MLTKSSTEEAPLYKQDWFWGLVGGVCAVVGVIVTTTFTIYRCKKLKETSAATQLQMSTTPIGIALDVDRDIKLITLDESNVTFNYTGSLSKTSWVDSKDTILVYDHNKNKVVDDSSEIVLTRWSKNAETDFEALLEVFDTNKDGIFNDQDNNFDQFYIWQDKNQNGVSDNGELTSLQDAGVKYIDFNTQRDATEAMKEQGILHTAEVHWTNGNITQAYDLIFEYEA